MKNNLKKILISQNKTQKELAMAVNITESAISRYIKGDREPKCSNAVKIANYLNLNIGDIWEL